MARVPALSVEIVKQSHDTKGFVVLPRRWVDRHVARRLNIDGGRQGDLVRHGGERRAALYTRSTHPGIGKPGLVEGISAMGNSERISPSTGCPMARCALGIDYRIGSAVFEVDAASAREDRNGRPRHQSGPGSPLGRLRRQTTSRLSTRFTERMRCSSTRNRASASAGGGRIQSSRAAQPNRKRFTVRRIIGAGDLWVTEFVLTYDGRPSYTVSIMEFLDGKVARETQYFGDPFEPGPSRAQWVERMP